MNDHLESLLASVTVFYVRMCSVQAKSLVVITMFPAKFTGFVKKKIVYQIAHNCLLF